MRSPEKKSGTNIAERIVKGLLAEANETRVADVRIGLGYTAVLLEGGGMCLFSPHVRKVSLKSINSKPIQERLVQ